MQYRGTCLDGPFQGFLIETEKEWIPVEATYKVWSEVGKIKIVILTGNYTWSFSRNGFIYDKIAHVEKTES